MLKKGLAAITLCAALAVGAQEPTVGTFLYGQATPITAPADPRFAQLTFSFERCGAIVRTSWYDADRVLLAADELEETDGKLARYRYWRPNVEESMRMTRSGAVLTIDRRAGGRSRSDELPVTEDVAAGPMMVLAAQRGLPQLQAGQRLQLRYAVPEKPAIYDFSMVRVAASAASLREVEVAPTSWLVRRFVHPLDLYFDHDGLLTRLRGRALPVMGTAAHEEPLEVEARVLRRETHSCSAQPGASAPGSPAALPARSDSR